MIHKTSSTKAPFTQARNLDYRAVKEKKTGLQQNQVLNALV